MLEELKNLNKPCGKAEILYFLTNIIGNKSVSRRDIKVLLSHVPGIKIDVEATIKYCLAFSWINGFKEIAVCKDILKYLDNGEQLNARLIDITINKLFEEGCFNERSFSFAIEEERIRFRNELFPLEFSAVRDVLVSQGFFVINRVNQITNFYVSKKYEDYLSNFLKDFKLRMTLNELKAELEAEALAGAKAESFVLQFEKKRLKKELAEKVQIISEIDVGAGYDIISFIDNSSTHYDCYIEVKAISRGFEFYWSMHEYKIAKLHGDQYKLYLVDLSKIADVSYQPYIISNPAEKVMKSCNWAVEPQSFRVKKALR